MSCTQRERLQKKYDKASATLEAARQRLGSRIGICPRGEFLALSDELDRAWEALESARTAMDDHIRMHCCLSQISAGEPE